MHFLFSAHIMFYIIIDWIKEEDFMAGTKIKTLAGKGIAVLIYITH